MYTIIKKVIEEKQEASSFEIHDFKIGDKTFEVGITESGIGFFSNPYGDSEFFIGLSNCGLYITRTVIRKNHDHDDVEYLCLKDGKITWIKDFFESRKYVLYIPIGCRIEE